MHIPLLLFSLILIGCGEGVSPPPVSVGTFQKYRARFQLYAEKYGVSVTGCDTFSVEFGQTDLPNTVAECRSGLFGKKIVVKEADWIGYDDGTRESIILHEFGHCVLKRDHRNDKIAGNHPGFPPDGAAASLMNQFFIYGSRYLVYQDYYLKELFSLPMSK